MTLDVVVADKSGKPVAGLEQRDFTLLDNKQPQKIVSFQAVDGGTATADPVEVVLLVDSVNTEFTNVAIERKEIEKFLLRKCGNQRKAEYADPAAAPGTHAIHLTPAHILIYLHSKLHSRCG